MATSRSLVGLLLCALAYMTLEQCFSRIASARPPESEPTAEVDAAVAPAAAAWLRAARRTAEGKKDSGAHWAVAWESTEAWWLRPVALTVSALFTLVAILQQLPGAYLRAVLASKPSTDAPRDGALPVFQERAVTREMRNEQRCSKCLSALQRMELPVFATAARWSEKDQGVLVAVNPRTPAVLEDWESHMPELQSLVVDALNAADLLSGDATVLHLLRGRQDESYELLVRFVQKSAPSSGLSGFSLLSLGCVYAATQWDTALRVADASDMLTVAAMSMLLLVLGEAAREVTARAQSVQLGARTFLPCPQLGLLGVFATAKSASPSKEQQLLLALSAPLTVLVASLLLAAADWDPSWTMQLQSATSGLGPLAHLDKECSVTSFVAAQGLLMASLALLPQSPDGRSAWNVLLGRENGEKLADTCGYVYPFLAVFAMWNGTGAAVLSLPFTWQLLLTNLTPSEQPPPLEEVTEPSMSHKGVSAVLLLAALWMAAPMPH